MSQLKGVNPYQLKAYILDVYRGHLDFPDQARMIKEKYDLWKNIAENYGWTGPIKIGVESVAYQKALAQVVFLQGLPAKEIKRSKAKLIRMIGLTPYFEGGRILLPDPTIEKAGWFNSPIRFSKSQSCISDDFQIMIFLKRACNTASPSFKTLLD